ncbi:MAG: hypothetical protein AMJ81_01790 [Phycisphaerae bacterium SM23_33]|nr:MAG: hypothetical protein AMJ81_01790 [Phycisphaerae bacterium SM23_33]
MARRYYFLLTSLPGLPVLGETPPVELADFRRMAAEDAAAAGLIDALLLDHDLVLREAAMAGEIPAPTPAVLTREQARGEAPLPQFLSVEPAAARRIPADAIWEAYYRYVDRLAGQRRCDFARRWVGFEVGLRNALVVARAAALKLDPQNYLVAEELALAEAGVDDVVAAWSEAPNPLAALRVLDEGRWRWTQEHSQYFSFALDELAAYARRLILVSRWHVLAREEAGNTISQDA